MILQYENLTMSETSHLSDETIFYKKHLIQLFYCFNLTPNAGFAFTAQMI